MPIQSTRIASNPGRHRNQPMPGIGSSSSQSGSGPLRIVTTVCVLLLSLLAAATGLAQESSDALPDAKVRISYDLERNRLSVTATDQPLVALLERIAQQTGVRLTIHSGDHGRVSAEFDDLPLADALQTLLEGTDYALERRDESIPGLTGQSDIVRVWVMSPRTKPGASPPTRLTNKRREALAKARAAQRNRSRTARSRTPAAVPDLSAALLPDAGVTEEALSEILQNPDLPQELTDAISEQMGQPRP